MANIVVDIIPEDDLTVFTVEGELSADQIIRYSSEYYMNNPTKYVLWDARKGSVHKINSDGFRMIAQQMQKYTIKRKGGKTAFVRDYDLDFGMGRMYEVFSEIEKLPVRYRVFRNIEEAKMWLLQD